MFFSKLVDGLLWGSSLVLTGGCVKMSPICHHILEASAQISAQTEDTKVRSLNEFSFLEFMNITHESNNPLLLHKFFKDITTHLPRLSYLFNQCGPVLYDTFLYSLISNHSKTLAKHDHYGLTPLHWATKNLNVQEVYMMSLFKRLIGFYNENNIDILSIGYKYNRYKSTPLQIAARYHSSQEMIKELVDKGANRHLRDPCSLSPLHLSAQNGDLEEVQWIINNGRDQIDEINQSGKTALHFAAENDQVKVVKWLIDNKADINKKTIHGSTPLHLASRLGHTAVVKLLLATPGIDPNIKNTYDSTPLHLASEYGQVAVVQLLISDKKVNLNGRDKDGKTPLDLASKPAIIIILKDANNKRKLSKNQTLGNKKLRK